MLRRNKELWWCALRLVSWTHFLFLYLPSSASLDQGSLTIRRLGALLFWRPITKRILFLMMGNIEVKSGVIPKITRLSTPKIFLILYSEIIKVNQKARLVEEQRWLQWWAQQIWRVSIWQDQRLFLMSSYFIEDLPLVPTYFASQYTQIEMFEELSTTQSWQMWWHYVLISSSLRWVVSVIVEIQKSMMFVLKQPHHHQQHP